MFRWTLLFAVVLAAVVGIVVGVMNPDAVTVKLPGLSLESPLGALLMIVFSIGLIVGCVLFFILFHLPAKWNPAPRSSRRSSRALSETNPRSNA
jgi:uncharacterized membrane protein YciS (DUF1049 family)